MGKSKESLRRKMLDTDRVEFAKILAATAEVYNSPISEAATLLYWNVLKVYEMEAVNNAFGKHLNDPDEGSFMPKPANIVKWIEGGGNDRSSLAWAKVLNAISDHGHVHSVRFDDRLIHKAIEDMGGWPLLCSYDYETMEFKRNEFVRLYNAYRVKPPMDIPNQLEGTVEIDNTAKGLPEFSPETKQIGERKMLKGEKL